MKNILLLLAVVVLLTSCGSDNGFEDKMKSHNRKLLDMALVNGDYITAINATQSLLLYDTSNFGLYDTLYKLYAEANNQKGILIVTSKIIETNPADVNALESYALAAKKLNLRDKVIGAYQKLYEIEPNTRYLYEIGVQLFISNNAEKGMEIFNKAASSPRCSTDMVNVWVNNQGFQVPVLPTIYNYIGYQHQLQGNFKDAEANYLKALEIFPNHVLANNNLAKLKSMK